MRRGQATVELMLGIPLFVLLIGFAAFHGSLARVVAGSPWVTDTILAYPDNSSLAECAALRSVDSNLTQEETKSLWRVGLPEDEVTTEIDSLVSADNEWTPEGPTTQDGDYTDDVLALEEEVVHLEQKISVGFDNLGRLTMTTFDSAERQLWASLRSGMDEDALEDSDVASWEMPEGRSRHREASLEFSVKAWLGSFLGGADTEGTILETARSRVRSADETDPWLFEDTGDFHDKLDDMFDDMGEDGATLEATPYWDWLRPYRNSN